MDYKHLKTFEQFSAEETNEGLFSPSWDKEYEKLDKANEELVKNFHTKLMENKISAKSDVGRNSTKLAIKKVDLTRRLKELEFAKSAKWDIVVTPSGTDYIVKDAKKVNFGSDFKSGGTGGHTGAGGV